MSSKGGFFPNWVPNRIPRTAYGAWLIFSVPPARTTEDSPSKISWQALTILWKPEPQRRLTVNAGVGMGTPLLKPTWRERYVASDEVWETFPKITESTILGSTFPAAKAAFEAWVARSVAVKSYETNR